MVGKSPLALRNFAALPRRFEGGLGETLFKSVSPSSFS